MLMEEKEWRHEDVYMEKMATQERERLDKLNGISWSEVIHSSYNLHVSFFQIDLRFENDDRASQRDNIDIIES